jgi:hypothetical protein
MRTPASITLAELAASAEKAALKADKEAKKAGVSVAGRKRKTDSDEDSDEDQGAKVA